MAISTLKRPLELLDNIYPVGSIYMNISNINPENLFGGTWIQLKDTMLLGVGDTYSENSTGGAATHTLITDELPSHSHTFTGSSATSGNQSVGHTHTYTDYYATTTGSTAISTAQLASHRHSLYGASGATDFPITNYGTWQQTTTQWSTSTWISDTGSDNGHTHTGANTSTSRTSDGISANHTHSFTAAGSIGNTGGGKSFSILPPYTTVYIWKRTA